MYLSKIFCMAFNLGFASHTHPPKMGFTSF
jgi:hypothetical protein